MVGWALKSALLLYLIALEGLIEETWTFRLAGRAAPHLHLQPASAAHPKMGALGDLYHLENKEQYPLKEWEEAVSYLLGCEVRFSNYEDIGKSLKPFSLKLR